MLQWNGSAAYKLNLLSASKIHPVVHVSQLKKHIAPSLQPSMDLSSVYMDLAQVLLPEVFLDTRLCEKGGSTVKQALVQWTALS